MQVKAKAVDKAVSLLKAAGVQFAIMTEGGRKIGDLQIVKPGEKRVPKRAHNVYVPHYKSAGVDTMKPGDVVTVPYHDKLPKGRLRHNLDNYAHRLWGAGSYIAANNGAGIELMRVK